MNIQASWGLHSPRAACIHVRCTYLVRKLDTLHPSLHCNNKFAQSNLGGGPRRGAVDT